MGNGARPESKLKKRSRKVNNFRDLFFVCWLCEICLLICAPGTSLSAGVAASLLGASACGVSPAPYSCRSLRAFRANQQSANINIYRHTAFSFYLLFLPNPIAFSIFFRVLLATWFAFSAPSSRILSSSVDSIRLLYFS